MRTSETIKEIAPAYAAFRAACPNPPKNKTNNHIGNSYSTLDIIIETAQPHLTENKLFIIQDVKTEGAKVSTQTTVCHESGEFFEFEPVNLTATKDTAQQIGSAMTYGRRYSLSIALGIASQEDDDGQEASQPQGGNNSGQRPQGGQSQKPNPTAISDNQKKKLNSLITKVATAEGIDATVFFKDHLQVAMNTKSPTKNWSKAQASQAITLLENWGKNKEGQADAKA